MSRRPLQFKWISLVHCGIDCYNRNRRLTAAPNTIVLTYAHYKTIIASKSVVPTVSAHVEHVRRMFDRV